MSTRRLTIYSGLIALLVLLALLWCRGQMDSARAQAVAAANDLRQCRRLIHRIQMLKKKPVMAGSQALGLTDLTGAIEKAADKATIDPHQLDRIWPMPSRRLGDSPYKQKPAEVVLQRVTLKQVTSFLVSLTAGNRRLRISSLRLMTPQTDEDETSVNNTGQEQWVAEVTISDLVYAPLSSGDGGVVDVHGP